MIKNNALLNARSCVTDAAACGGCAALAGGVYGVATFRIVRNTRSLFLVFSGQICTFPMLYLMESLVANR